MAPTSLSIPPADRNPSRRQHRYSILSATHRALLKFWPFKRGRYIMLRLLRHVPPFWAPMDGFEMHLDPSDFIQLDILIYGFWEPEIEAAARSLRPGDCFVDIGANVGYFSLMAASRGASVLAFEPQPSVMGQLLANAKRNRLAVQAVQAACGAEPGNCKLYLDSAENSGQASLSAQNADGAPIDVAIVVPDDEIQRRGMQPTLIKIDVQGFEVSVLRGLHRTLSRYDPVLVVEVEPPLLRNAGSSPEELLALLRNYGYSWKMEGGERKTLIATKP
jgi:FkbM family methyltransferase